MNTMEERRRILEACVNEFFAPLTSNDRKREIEIMLDHFSKEEGAWREALYFLSTSSSSSSSSSSTSNQYVIMFCLSVIENSIKYRWLSSMNASERNELKSTLYSFIIQQLSSSRFKNFHFLRNKMIKLLCDIGKFAWPHGYPDFFANILQMLVQNDDGVIITGLYFLKTISEEWTVIKDEVSTDRKNELKLLLVDQMKNIFQAVERILVAALKQRAVMLPVNSSDGNHQHDLENQPPVHCQLDEIISLTLETAAHYCSWIPLDGVVPNLSDPKLKASPFSVDFVQLLCQISLADIGDSNATGNSISSLALGVLNELLYRKFIPKEFDDQLNFIVRFSVELLNKLLTSSRGNSTVFDSQFVEKVIEFLCLVASAHFHRLDEATAKAFMTLLLPFTFQQEESGFYYDCLEIWARLLDHLNAQIPILNFSSPSREDFLSQIKQPIMGLATGIIHSNAKFNSVYDDFFPHEDDEESVVPGIGRNIDVLVKVGELLPAESLQSVTATWEESCRFYLALQNQMNESKTLMLMENPSELDHFNFVVQLIGRVANIFYGDVFRNELPVGKSIFQQLVGLCVFSRNYYQVQSPQQISQSNLELISATKTWTYWLSRYHAEVILASEATTAATSLQEQQHFFEILNLLLDNIFYSLEHRETIDNDIVSLNVHFFATLVSTVRTQYLFHYPRVQGLIRDVHNLRHSLDSETYRILHKAVCGILLLPWYNAPQQEWETRTGMYVEYMKKLSSDLIVVDDSRGVGGGSGGAVNLICGLHLLNDQLTLLSSECGMSKKICWGFMKELVPYLQDLSLGYFLRLPNVCEELLTFFLKVMEVLQQQAGASFFERAVRNFLNYFSTENIIDDLLQEQENATFVVEKFLQMLQYMVKDPSPAFKKFLPDALSICYDHIYPIISGRSSPDLKVPLFSLVRDAVNYRWSYFFPSLHHLVRSLNSSSNRNQQEISQASTSSPSSQDSTVASKCLDQIFQSVGQSFLQSDLEVFKFNLASLTLWNEKHGFFTKVATQFPHIFDQFMMVLFQVLLQKSHDILRDDISLVLCDMAKVDFGKFCNKFLPDFLTLHFLALTEEQRELLLGKFKCATGGGGGHGDFMMSGSRHRTDLNKGRDSAIDTPTFTLMLGRFVDDLRFYHFIIECERMSRNNVNKVSSNSQDLKSRE